MKGHAGLRPPPDARVTAEEADLLRALLVAVSLALLLARDGDAQTELQCPELPFSLLVSFSYPCPIAPRVCRTDYGQCRIGIQPGTPCRCRASSNGR